MGPMSMIPALSDGMTGRRGRQVNPVKTNGRPWPGHCQGCEEWSQSWFEAYGGRSSAGTRDGRDGFRRVAVLKKTPPSGTGQSMQFYEAYEFIGKLSPWDKGTK